MVDLTYQDCYKEQMKQLMLVNKRQVLEPSNKNNDLNATLWLTNKSRDNRNWIGILRRSHKYVYVLSISVSGLSWE